MEAKNTLFMILLDLLDIENRNITPESEFNLFEYDSFTKINVIMAIEVYADTNQVDFDKLISCDTFQQVIDLADSLKE